MATILGNAGPSTLAALRSIYGSKADSFGATALVERIVATAIDLPAMSRAALALTVAEYYRAFARAPAAQPGGLTNPDNAKRRARLEPYLFARLRAALVRHIEASLITRSVGASLPDNWLSARGLEAALQRQLTASNMFERVDVSVDLRAPDPGGDTLLRQQTRSALQQAKDSLAHGAPLALEVIRDTAAVPLSEQVVVAIIVEGPDDSRTRLTAYDPTAGDEPVVFDLRFEQDRMIVFDEDPDEERPPPLGLVAIDSAFREPPMFGLRNITDILLPWRLFFSLGRRWQTLGLRRRERKLRGLSAGTAPPTPLP